MNVMQHLSRRKRDQRGSLLVSLKDCLSKSFRQLCSLGCSLEVVVTHDVFQLVEFLHIELLIVFKFIKLVLWGDNQILQ